MVEESNKVFGEDKNEDFQQTEMDQEKQNGPDVPLVLTSHYIPPEIITLMFSFLSGDDICRTGVLVCKEWNEILDNEEAWKERFFVEFTKEDKLEEERIRAMNEEMENHSLENMLGAALMKKKSRRNIKKSPLRELPSCFSIKQKYIMRLMSVQNKCAFCYNCYHPTTFFEEVKILACLKCKDDHFINKTKIKKRYLLTEKEISLLTKYNTITYFVDEIQQYFDQQFEDGMNDEVGRRRSKRDNLSLGRLKKFLNKESQWKQEFIEGLEKENIPKEKINNCVEKYVRYWSHGPVEEVITQVVSKIKREEEMIKYFKEITGKEPTEEQRKQLKTIPNRFWIFSMDYPLSDDSKKILEREIHKFQRQSRVKTLVGQNITKISNGKYSVDYLPPISNSEFETFCMEMQKISCTSYLVELHHVDDDNDNMQHESQSLRKISDFQVNDEDLEIRCKQFAETFTPMLDREKFVQNIFQSLGYQYENITKAFKNRTIEEYILFGIKDDSTCNSFEKSIINTISYIDYSPYMLEGKQKDKIEFIKELYESLFCKDEVENKLKISPVLKDKLVNLILKDMVTYRTSKITKFIADSVYNDILQESMKNIEKEDKNKNNPSKKKEKKKYSPSKKGTKRKRMTNVDDENIEYEQPSPNDQFSAKNTTPNGVTSPSEVQPVNNGVRRSSRTRKQTRYTDFYSQEELKEME